MSKLVRVVTDSGADLSPELCAEYGIEVVPLTITFGTQEFKDGVDLGKDAFLERLKTSPDMPFTTQPSPADFAAVFERLRDEGVEQVISVHLSSKLSGTHQSAALGARQVEGIEVRVIDSLSASLGIGLLAIEAAKSAASGQTMDEISRRLEVLRDRIGLFFRVDTLEYLAKNGRIGRAQALLGGMLSIKPVLTVNSGVVEALGKARGKRKALELVLDALKKHVGGNKFTGAIVHAGVPDEAAALKDELLEIAPGSDIGIHMLGPTIVTHAGPGTLGVIAFAP